MAATTDHTHIYRHTHTHSHRHTHSDTENLQISLCHCKNSRVSLFTVMCIWTHLPKHLQLSPSIGELQSIAVSAQLSAVGICVLAAKNHYKSV